MKFGKNNNLEGRLFFLKKSCDDNQFSREKN